MVCGRTFRVEFLHQQVEGRVLVVEGRQVRFPDTFQDLGEGLLPGHVRTQDQGVDEEPDQVVQRGIRTARDRAAQWDVLARPRLGQRDRQGRLHHHEQGAAMFLGHARQPRVQVRVHLEADTLTSMRGVLGPRPIQRQFENLRHTVKGPFPEVELLGEQTIRIVGVPQDVVLPERVVRVLHRQRLPPGRLSGAARGVGRGQIANEHALGPAIRGDVVHQDHQHRPPRPTTEVTDPNRPVGGQVERRTRELFHQRVHLIDGALHPLELRTPPGRLQHLLVRLARLLSVHRPQDLVPFDHVAQRCFQGGGVHTGVEPHHHGHVVCRTRPFEAVQEPQPPLRVGQRGPLPPIHGNQLRTGHDTPPPSDQPIHTRNRRITEEVTEPYLRLEHRPHPRDQPQRQQRVTTRTEEVLPNPHRVHTQQLREQTPHDLLARSEYGPLDHVLHHRLRKDLGTGTIGQRLTLVLGQLHRPPHHGLGFGRHRLQHPNHHIDQGPHRALIEQIRGELDHTRKPGRGLITTTVLHEPERQIELGRTQSNTLDPSPHPIELRGRALTL